MGTISTVPILLTFVGSFIIAVLAARIVKSTRVEDHLFAGNKPGLAIASELGSLFSLSVSCTALISGGYIYGWQILIPLFLGVIVAVKILRGALQTKKLRNFLKENRKRRMEAGASLFVFLGAERGALVTVVYSVWALLFYFFLLATELLLARLLLERLTGATGVVLFMVMTILVATCYAYVFIGGYRGVLYTDHFQFLLILIFSGALLGITDLSSVTHKIPSITTSLLPDSFEVIAALHCSVFIGTVMVLLGTPDHWTRLLGTLDLKDTVPTLSLALPLFGIGAALPILLGSTLHSDPHIPKNLTNEASLYLIESFLHHSTPGVLFLFFMVMACVLLTTLDTYIITTQQIYYEFAIHFHAKRYRWYLLEWLLKWKQVRGFSLVPVMGATLFTMMFPDMNVYVLGVYALTTGSFWAPSFLLEILAERSPSIDKLISHRTQILSLTIGILFSPIVILILANRWGPVEDRLFLIFSGGGLASIGSHILVLALKRVVVASGARFSH